MPYNDLRGSKTFSLNRIVVLIVLLMCIFEAASQSQAKREEFIKVYGKLLDQKDSSSVQASVSYEKLPYFDDVGTVLSGVDGEFEFYLMEGVKYSFLAEKDGYYESSKEIIIDDTDKDGLFIFSMYIEPGKEFELITLDNLIFARGAARISESSNNELDELVEWLKERPTTIIQLEGHTDFAGNSAANMRLSQARVEAVKEYLLKKKVKKNRVFIKAFGGTQPITTQRTDEAKAQNRRVEVRIIAK